MAVEESVRLVERSSAQSTREGIYAEDDFADPLSPSVNAYNINNKAVSSWLIALAFFVTVLGFTVQIEAIAYYEDVLGWSKPFSSLYVTHSSLCLPWIFDLLYRRAKAQDQPLRVWTRRYIQEVYDELAAIEVVDSHARSPSQLTWFFLRAMLLVTVALTVSGVSWFAALAFTTPGDLTAIYNCSTFFAAIFSVPILHERLRWTAMVAVALSIVGTFIIAYGDSGSEGLDSRDESAGHKIGAARLFGNLIAAVGAIGFGLYSVLFKRWTTQKAEKGSNGLLLILLGSAMTGLYTLAIGWVVIIVLHITGLEEFELPSLQVSFYLAISVISGAVSLTLLLVLVTWTTPVFGNITAVVSVLFVAVADWLVFGLLPSAAVYIGGGLIFVAFGILARDELAS